MNDEKNSVSTIQFADTEIVSLRPEMLKIVTKMQESWKKVAQKSDVRYFG